MKQILQNFKTGELKVEEVPRPQVRPGAVLVKNLYSLISAGTEGGTVALGKMSLLGKARARPEQVKKVIGVIRTEGLLTAYQAATRALEMPVALGYSSAGRIVETGEGVSDFKAGDLVACAGANMAVHAEYVVVPRHLCARIPEGLEPRLAAFTTIGCVALHGLHVAGIGLGETAVVIGLGLVGLLTVGLLEAAGVKVLGVDVDPAKVKFAEDRGLCRAWTRSAGNLEASLLAAAGGLGADAVFITAAAPTNDPLVLAGRLARPRGRVIVVGRTEMHAPRETYLFKELELRTSYAYGPGVGDPEYEEQGRDYPLSYVRWTENRNMAAFLDLAAAGRLRLADLVTHEYPLEAAAQAYQAITDRDGGPSLAVLLKYDPEDREEPKRVPGRAVPAKTIGAGTVRVGVLGAGSFATNFLVPALAGRKDLVLRGIASTTGVKAKALGDKYGFEYCAADPKEIIEDDRTDCVFILTRHDSHAPLALAALEAGKHVFVEKPLALNQVELAEVIKARQETGLEVRVGFNRPFADLSLKLAGFLAGRRQPLAAIYRANVGFRPPEHWLHDPRQGGGVILAEACHFIDYCHWLAGADPVLVQTLSLSGAGSGLINEDNVHLEMSFADGSLATIAYLSCGDPAGGRERLEVMAEGGLAVLEDFKELALFRQGRKTRHRAALTADKGYSAEIESFLAAARGRARDPRLFRRQALSSLATIEAVESLRRGGTPRPVGAGALFGAGGTGG
ncbi:MAG: bi-domain-containing oxidoreductase [Thermodesulfobacteriota bacterium]